MRRNFWIILGAIVVLIVLAGLVDWPTGPNIQIGKYYKELKVHEGLDLQGGTHLVYELDTTGLKQEDINSALQSVSDIMDRRVNSLGVAEATVQTAKIGGKDAVLIELPGVMDISEALRRIGKTAHLQFLEQDEKGELKATELTGANLKKSDVTFESQSNEPQVSLEFNEEGTKLLKEITKRNLQKPLAPELDGEIISMPIVQSVISSGKAVITGQFTVKDATELATLLNAGALPVPIKVAQQYSIGPTLGREAVQKSLIAGLIGIALVALFMIVLYRLPGVIATLALIIYTLIVLAIFKLIPVTLTLSGIAGFILSIGMAVDANILIFERTKEELRLGKTGGLAIDEGFKRAWTSIRDSNISSLITCLILYFCTTGLVRGFAITLAIGIVVSMFTAISVTKTFLTLTTMFKGRNE
jgi:preprotein translocase subunit SecD